MLVNLELLSLISKKVKISLDTHFFKETFYTDEIFCYNLFSLYLLDKAGVAQLVEQLICNQSVMSSSLFTSYLMKLCINII